MSTSYHRSYARGGLTPGYTRPFSGNQEASRSSITVAELTAGFSDANAASHDTASVSHAAGKKSYCIVSHLTAGGGSFTCTGVASSGRTWTSVASQALTTGWIGIFESTAVGATSGAVTISWSGTVECAVWSVIEFTGANANAAAVQTNPTSHGSVNTFTDTLSAFEHPNNMCIAAARMGGNVTSYTTNLTPLSSQVSTTPICFLKVDYGINATSWTPAWATNRTTISVMAEVKAA